MAEYRERWIQPMVEAALDDTRVVVVLGARQVGKSTMVAHLAGSDAYRRPVITLDDQATREAARSDATGFVAGLPTPIAIDEAQRAPDVLLAIKQRVDTDTSPGQFLLTGSANLLTAPAIADALTGRAEYLRLQPFSQGELRGLRESFIPRLFAADIPQLADQPVGRAAYADIVVAGGYPDAVTRRPDRRARYFESYVTTLLERDLSTLVAVADHSGMRRLLQALAAGSAGELNFDRLSRDLGVAANTVRARVDLLETLFLVRRLPPWSRNLVSRTIKAPKAYVADSGLLAALLGIDAQRLAGDPNVAGPVLETFVAMELARQADSTDTRVALHHFRDRDQREVDVILERPDGSICAVEVKSAASVGPSDLRGLRYLRDKLGKSFACGVLLYTGATTVPFGDRLSAVPISALWA